MEEIAETFHGIGVTGKFHEAAADIFHRIAHLKDTSAKLSLEEIIAAVTQSREIPP
ncbi:MAG: hypothetical protein P1P89_23055 [Desulfobacterales bacterium]|nr:hypothetical protein [Desulfobacterales bacterium]